MGNSKIFVVIDTRLLAARLSLTMSMAGCSGGGSTMTSGSQSPSLAAGLGGSNYLTYHLDPPCNREPCDLVYNYDTAAATINAQLQQMYANGQRRLRIPIFHGRGVVGSQL